MENTYSLPTEEKFVKMQQMMFVILPSLTSFYCMCQKNAVDNEDVTMRLNTKTGSTIVLEYNEKFVQTLSVESLFALITVELFRLLLHHPTTRMQADPGLTVTASNYVCTDQKTMSFILPKELKPIFPKVSDLLSIDPQFNVDEDLFLERVYSMLEQQQQQNGGGSGESEESDGEDEADGEGEGSGKSDSEKESDSLKKHFSPKQSAKNAAEWGENEIIDAQVSDEVNKRQLSSWSDIGEGVLKKILKANELQFDPRSVLKRFTTSVFSDAISFTRMRPNRRLPKMTGILPGKRHAQQAKVLFAIDCSGSMAESEIERACGVVNSTLKHAEVSYCFWDCQCSDFTEKKSKMSDFTGLGGGGTNPDCVMKKIDEEKARFDGIVFITDCYFDWEEPKGKQKIFILHTKDAGNPPAWCKWHLGMDDIEKIANG